MANLILGVEKLLKSTPSWLKGNSLGLLSNQASVDSQFHSTVDLLHTCCPSNLKVLFGPQHGILGEKQENMVESPHSIHPRYQLPVFSLYSASRTPSREMFEPIDILIIDLQDVGTRVYTFITTMAYCLKAAKHLGKKVMVLDRPNPVGGTRVEGNLLREELYSFVGVYSLPMRHGMTIGELALLFNNYCGIGCELEVIPMEGWHRDMLFSETGLPWIPPSPNMPTPLTTMVYPGQVLLEGTCLSEGRGTTRPFEICGAPFIDPYQLKKKVAERNLPGIYLREVFFQPTFHKWRDEVCAGIQLHVTDPRSYKPYLTTLAIIQDVLSLYPHQFSWRPPPYEYEREKMPIDLLVGNKSVREALEQQEDLLEIEHSWQRELEEFRTMAQNYFLYQ